MALFVPALLRDFQRALRAADPIAARVGAALVGDLSDRRSTAPIRHSAEVERVGGLLRLALLPMIATVLALVQSPTVGALWALAGFLFEAGSRQIGEMVRQRRRYAPNLYIFSGFVVSAHWTFAGCATWLSGLDGASYAGPLLVFGCALYAVALHHQSPGNLAALLAPPLAALLILAPTVERDAIALMIGPPTVLIIGLIVATGYAAHTVHATLRRYAARLGEERDGLEARVAERTADLTAAMARADAASQAKSQFLANMSHELRTPLTAVIGYAEMLEEDLAAGDAQPGDVKRIQSAARHLLGLINEILDLSKVEAGRMELALEDVDLAGLSYSVADTVRPLAAANGNRLLLGVEADLGSIRTDATRLRQCLLNLLSNAARFTKDGVVALSVEARGDRVAMVVTDTGIGMSAEQLARLFQPFSQADASITRKFGGTGLGLAITKRLTELMGGEVLALSAPNAGSTFTILLPRAGPAVERLRDVA